MARKYVPGSFFQARKMRAPDQKWEGGIRMLQTVGIGKEFQIIRNGDEYRRCVLRSTGFRMALFTHT